MRKGKKQIEHKNKTKQLGKKYLD